MLKTVFLLGSILLLWPAMATAQTINLDTVIEQAVQKTYDVKLSKLDIEISKTQVKEKQADFYPSIQLRTYSEYLGDLNNSNSPTTVVGQTILPSGTRFQNSVSLNTTITAFDFGVRKRQVDIARKDVSSKRAILRQQIRDLKIKLIDLYADTLITYRQIKEKKAVIPLYQALYTLNKRLYNSGQATKLTVTDNAVQLAQTMADMDLLKQHFGEDLIQLGYYTQVQYNQNTVEVTDLENDVKPVLYTFNSLILPEYENYQIQIEAKKEELSVLKRQRLPSLSLYSYYNLYGSNVNSIYGSYQNIQSRNVTFGFSFGFPLFDGFKNTAQQARAILEAQHLEIERDEKIAQIKTTYDKAQLSYQNYDSELNQENDTVVLNQTKLDMVKRLTTQKLLDQLQILYVHRDIYDKQLASDLTRTKQIAAVKKMRVIAQQ